MNYENVIDFGKDVDILTIEIENVNTEALDALEKKGFKVYPQSSILKIIQNKCHQKQFYQKIKFQPLVFKFLDQRKN